MLQKYRNVCDNDLVLDYKKTHHEDLENEIIFRYKKNSKLLAGLLYSKYKFLYQVEYDDIYCILLGSLFSAIRGFTDNSIDFYQYWRKTATHEVMNYVRNFTTDNRGNEISVNAYNEEPVLVGYLREGADNLKDDYFSSFELDEIFSNPKNKFSQNDIDLFNLYTGGYSTNEIAELTNLTYKQIRYRIRIIKRKLANILFNQ